MKVASFIIKCFVYPCAYAYVHARRLKWFFQNLRPIPEVEEDPDLIDKQIDAALGIHKKKRQYSTLHSDVIDAVSNANFKTMGETCISELIAQQRVVTRVDPHEMARQAALSQMMATQVESRRRANMAAGLMLKKICETSVDEIRPQDDVITVIPEKPLLIEGKV